MIYCGSCQLLKVDASMSMESDENISWLIHLKIVANLYLFKMSDFSDSNLDYN